MEGYLKRFFVGHLLALIMIACAIFYFGISQVFPVLLFIGFIECLFYYLDTKYLPKRKAALTNKLIDTFQAEPLSEGVLKFKLDTIDFFVKIKIDFKQGLQLANIETIKFHIPRTQINKLSLKDKHNLSEDTINEVQTYCIYKTDGSELSHAKEALRKLI